MQDYSKAHYARDQEWWGVEVFVTFGYFASRRRNAQYSTPIIAESIPKIQTHCKRSWHNFLIVNAIILKTWGFCFCPAMAERFGSVAAGKVAYLKQLKYQDWHRKRLLSHIRSNIYGSNEYNKYSPSKVAGRKTMTSRLKVKCNQLKFLDISLDSIRDRYWNIFMRIMMIEWYTQWQGIERLTWKESQHTNNRHCFHTEGVKIIIGNEKHQCRQEKEEWRIKWIVNCSHLHINIIHLGKLQDWNGDWQKRPVRARRTSSKSAVCIINNSHYMGEHIRKAKQRKRLKKSRIKVYNNNIKGIIFENQREKAVWSKEANDFSSIHLTEITKSKSFVLISWYLLSLHPSQNESSEHIPQCMVLLLKMYMSYGRINAFSQKCI